MMKKYGRITTVVPVVFVLTLLLASGTLAGEKKGFNGAWESIDVDGSYQVMVIQDSYPYYLYYDFGATACGLDLNGQPMYAASFNGSPVIVGNALTVEGKVLCASDNPYYFPEEDPITYSFEFTYNKNKDTLYGGLPGFGATWYRIKK
jgi:hypothetical protein